MDSGCQAKGVSVSFAVMNTQNKRLFICSCDGTMPIDATKIGSLTGASTESCRELCRQEIDKLRSAAATEGPIQVCCTQETPVFDEVLADAGYDGGVTYVNIRETAGWSSDAAAATPKMAALIAAAAVEAEPTRTVTLRSEGRVLIYGAADIVLPAAVQLSPRLSVTAVLTSVTDGMPLALTLFPVFKGRIVALKGALGTYQATVDGNASMMPSSRDSLAFGAASNGVLHDADIILDLHGGDPLVSGGDVRDGYLRADPGSPAAVQKALFDASDLVGEFEKPIYISFTDSLCAHSRSTVTGCTKCLDICPASAIEAAGDHVAIDLQICAGCGACAGVCPTGAAVYDLPSTQSLYLRLRTLLRTYRDAGGENPVVLFHDTDQGAAMIAMMSRFGRGLPARVLPVALNEVTQLSFDVLASTLAYGAEKILILANAHRPENLEGLGQQIEQIEAVMAGLGHGRGCVVLSDQRDPDQLCEMLYDMEILAPRAPASFLPVGGRRSLSMMALHHLRTAAPTPVEQIEMPEGAPFGAVNIDVDGCTLCLACVGACPTGALADNPDAPMLRFTEQSCIQCGLCQNTCPESVMTLEPRINFDSSANSGIILKEEAPFECVSCGKPFGAKSSVERTLEKLSRHPMFANDETALNRLRMCEDCRVTAQFAVEQPMAFGTQRRTRTTEDYLIRPEEMKDDEDD